MDTKWIVRMLEVATTVSSWSPCVSGKTHACVLAIDGKYIISTGVNGPNHKVNVPNCMSGECGHQVHCNAIHAEVNAVINAARVGAEITKCIAYCTKQPCEMCRSVLINAGIRKVYWAENNWRMEKFSGNCEILNED